MSSKICLIVIIMVVVLISAVLATTLPNCPPRCNNILKLDPGIRAAIGPKGKNFPPSVPILTATSVATSPPNITGNWISYSCDVFPQGAYFVRAFTFTPTSWQAWFYTYADSACTVPLFIFHIGGPFQYTGMSPIVMGGADATLFFTFADLTALNTVATGILNSLPAGTCGSNPYKVDVSQDLVPTNGCSFFGIVIPSQEVQLIKREFGLLFLAQRPNNGTIPSLPSQRGTTYTYPLYYSHSHCGH